MSHEGEPIRPERPAQPMAEPTAVELNAAYAANMLGVGNNEAAVSYILDKEIGEANYKELNTELQGEVKNLKDEVSALKNTVNELSKKADDKSLDETVVVKPKADEEKPSGVKRAPVVAARERAQAKVAEAKQSTFADRLKNRKAAIVAAGALAVGGLLGYAIGNSGNEKTAAPVASASTQESYSTASQTSTTTGGAEAGSATTADSGSNSTPRVSSTTLNKYRNIDTGSDAHELIGNFEITNNAEQTQANFYREVRHNPETLAEMKAALEVENPTYATTVGDPEVLARMNELKTRYEHMSASEKAPIARRVISQLKAMRYGGVKIHNGQYKTVAVKDGKFVAELNSRSNDQWISFTDADGNTIYIRECAQLVAPIPGHKTTTSTPGGRTTTTVHVPGKRHPVTTMQGGKSETTPEKPGKQPKPTTPKPTTTETNLTPPPTETPKPTTTETTPTPPPVTPPPTPPKVPEKNDPNPGDPAGVPGENPGDPDPVGAGQGPSGQTPNPNGTVGNEQLPAAPAPAPSPTHEQPAPTPSAPAETGSEPAPGPSTQAPGTSNQQPSGSGGNGENI